MEMGSDGVIFARAALQLQSVNESFGFEDDIVELSNPENISFIEELYSCETMELCLIKYICGIVSLALVILYSTAVYRIQKRKKTFPLDLRDHLLLSLALAESALTLIYHILFDHLIFLFIIRVAKILEQVTICLILIELTLKKQTINLRTAFTYALVVCLLSTGIVSIVVIFEGTTSFLHEKRLFWTLLSGLQVIISLVTFSLAIRLMCLDPHWAGKELE